MKFSIPVLLILVGLLGCKTTLNDSTKTIKESWIHVKSNGHDGTHKKPRTKWITDRTYYPDSILRSERTIKLRFNPKSDYYEEIGNKLEIPERPYPFVSAIERVQFEKGDFLDGDYSPDYSMIKSDKDANGDKMELFKFRYGQLRFLDSSRFVVTTITCPACVWNRPVSDTGRYQLKNQNLVLVVGQQYTQELDTVFFTYGNQTIIKVSESNRFFKQYKLN